MAFRRSGGTSLVEARPTTIPTLRARPNGTTTSAPGGGSSGSGTRKSNGSSSGTSSATRAIFKARIDAPKGGEIPVDKSVNSRDPAPRDGGRTGGPSPIAALQHDAAS